MQKEETEEVRNCVKCNGPTTCEYFKCTVLVTTTVQCELCLYKMVTLLNCGDSISKYSCKICGYVQHNDCIYKDKHDETRTKYIPHVIKGPYSKFTH